MCSLRPAWYREDKGTSSHIFPCTNDNTLNKIDTTVEHVCSEKVRAKSKNRVCSVINMESNITSIHDTVWNSGVPNFVQVRIPVPSNIRI